MHKRIAAGIAAGALVLGAGGVAIMLPSLVAAADPTSSPSATSPAATTAPANSSGSDSSNSSGSSGSGDTTTPPANCDGAMHGPGMGSDDIAAAAKALGMSEADVTAALQNGQTLADLAAQQNVDVQTLVDAMVAAEKAEIQAKVDDGTITQDQADQMIANLTQHETDEVNGTFSGGGPGGTGGPGGHGGFHGQPPSGTAPSDGTTPSTTTPSTTSDSTSS